MPKSFTSLLQEAEEVQGQAEAPKDPKKATTDKRLPKILRTWKGMIDAMEKDKLDSYNMKPLRDRQSDVTTIVDAFVDGTLAPNVWRTYFVNPLYKLMKDEGANVNLFTKLRDNKIETDKDLPILLFYLYKVKDGLSSTVEGMEDEGDKRNIELYINEIDSAISHLMGYIGSDKKAKQRMTAILPLDKGVKSSFMKRRAEFNPKIAGRNETRFNRRS